MSNHVGILQMVNSKSRIAQDNPVYETRIDEEAGELFQIQAHLQGCLVERDVFFFDVFGNDAVPFDFL